MDKGAHFFKCDFQIHSPRDINWGGRKFGLLSNDVSPSEDQKDVILKERLEFAKEYLRIIRSKGIRAIAITDHHDVVFAKLIRNIAKIENEQYVKQSQTENCITVFPGIELTLSNPACQSLLIFDSDFPDADLESIVNFLGFHPIHEFNESTNETARISQSIINDLNDLHNKLDELGYCKLKYIVLPNLNFGGSNSILRQGFHEHYRKMPCVGGYVDGDISDDAGYINKLNGGDINYGNKSIGVISTSDNRFEDGRNLGQFTTWIKWSEPTAEALRQAFLAKESRLSIRQPELPQIYISNIDVTNSKFLGSFTVDLNQQYNALIGGRGTGKSTILEYLRWGLCDQTIELYKTEEHFDVEKRRQSLIEKTLVPFNGEVRITFSLNGVVHIVKRNSINRETTLKIGMGGFEVVTEDELRKILPIQAYSQKQLSGVGIRTDELKRFIEQPIANELENLKYQISDTSKKIRSSYNNFLRKQEIQNEIDKFNLEIKSLTDQVGHLRKSLSDLSEEDQKTIATKQKYENEENFIKKCQSEISVITSKLEEFQNSLQHYPEKFQETSIENQKLIESIQVALKKKFDEIKEVAQVLKDSVSQENMKEISDLIKTWKDFKDLFETQYESAKVKASSSKTQLLEIHRIEVRLNDLSNSLNDRLSIIKELGTPELEFDKLRKEWFELYDTRLQFLSEQSEKFTQLSEGLIKAEIKEGLDTDTIKNHLLISFQGTRITENKIEMLCNYIKESENPLQAWRQLTDELRILAEFKTSGVKSSEKPDSLILTRCDFNDKNRTKIVEILTPEKWINIATLEIDFVPKFKYTTNNRMGDVIPFEDASAGQQATALLKVLLNQSGTPLIIDQPEDDIDNKAVEDIIQNIWKAKRKRQLIFTSHNANLVVNGDAELVICCDYRESGNQTRGVIKAEGAIDNKNVKNEITSVMEGGEKAFRLRKEKYGF